MFQCALFLGGHDDETDVLALTRSQKKATNQETLDPASI